MVDTNGSIKLCCVAEDPTLANKYGEHKTEGQNMTVRNSSLSEAWNSEYMESVRERMISGRQVKDCSQCYRREKQGQYSFRQRANDDWQQHVQQVTQYYDLYKQDYAEADQILQKRMSVTKHYVELPVYLDIRFGNLCNLKCRMCTGLYSKKLGEELNEISQQDEAFRQIAGDTAKVHDFDWYDDNFWNDLEKYLPRINLLYLTGGEPTLVEGNYNFLQGLIDKGYAKNISLVFNTNATNFQQRFLDTVSHFAHITFNLSIDGIEGVQEYIRYPSKWKAIEKNMFTLMDKIKDSKHTQFNLVFTPTVNVLNVGSFDKLVNWAYHFATNNNLPKVQWNMEPIMLQGPQFQDMAWANKNYKQFALHNLNSIDSNAYKTFKSLKQFVNKMKLTLLKIEDKLESKANNKQLHKWNTELDKHRGIDIKDYIEYSDMIYE